MRRKLAIAAGGTAGHVTAGLAIAQAYQSSFDNLDLFFFGRRAGIEETLVASRGYRFEKIAAYPYSRQNALGKARAVIEFLHGTAHARHVLQQQDRKLVIGLGGYVATGAVVAAYSLRIATMIHEANIIPGRANLLLSRLVDRVCLASERTQTAFPRKKIVITGNPLRQEILDAGDRSRAPSCENPNGEREYRILVTGGSEGSPFLNRNAPALLARMASLGVPLSVQHQTGSSSRRTVHALYENAGLPARVEHFFENMPGVYNWAEFVITAGGALTLAELAWTGLPALVVPSSAVSNHHQTANAIAFTQCGDNLWISERAWDPDVLAKQITAKLVNSRRSLEAENVNSNATQARPANSALKIVEECERLMQSRW